MLAELHLCLGLVVYRNYTVSDGRQKFVHDAEVRCKQWWWWGEWGLTGWSARRRLLVPRFDGIAERARRAATNPGARRTRPAPPCPPGARSARA